MIPRTVRTLFVLVVAVTSSELEAPSVELVASTLEQVEQVEASEASCLQLELLQRDVQHQAPQPSATHHLVPQRDSVHRVAPASELQTSQVDASGAIVPVQHPKADELRGSNETVLAAIEVVHAVKHENIAVAADKAQVHFQVPVNQDMSGFADFFPANISGSQMTADSVRRFHGHMTALSENKIGQPSGAGQRVAGHSNSHPLHVAAAAAGVTIPINSAGEHTGRQRVVDVVLLMLCLLTPFLMYGVVRFFESREEKSADANKKTAAPDEKSGIRRIGSSYGWPEEAQNRVSLTGAMSSPSREVQMKEADEGPFLQNVLAGFSTAMAALPDAISFSFITGVSPLNGIWAGVIMGITAGLLGGRPGMISSASAATAVVLATISTDGNLGMGPMALCVFLVGVFQCIAGALRLSRFITLIPHSVMIGFVNGLAIIMVRAQLRQFHLHGDGPWVEGPVVLAMTITALFAMLVAFVWPRIPFVSRVIPAPLASVAITAVFSIVFAGVLPRRTLRDVAGAHTFAGGIATMPSWDFPPQDVNWHDQHMWISVISIAIRFAIVGLLESLMTQSLIDQITGTGSSMRRECFGQGVGNILSSFFGLQGGCALIAQSLMNVGSGGRSRVSGVTMGLSLAGCVVLLAPLIGEIPVAALVGLITLIAMNTFAWSSFQLILRINRVDAFTVVLVTVVTVWQDLATAVVAGVIVSGLGFAWHTATDVRVVSMSTPPNQRTFYLKGPLFFGSAMNYRSEVTKTHIPERVVVLDFTQGKILDISAIDAIKNTRDYLRGEGKHVILNGVPAEARREMPP